MMRSTSGPIPMGAVTMGIKAITARAITKVGSAIFNALAPLGKGRNIEMAMAPSKTRPRYKKTSLTSYPCGMVPSADPE